MENNDYSYLSLKEVQSLENDILKAVVLFFNMNNIQYILCGGTMLGAVRHNGFIPWDDDIDILVPRKDYDKIIQLVKAGKAEMGAYSFRIPGDERYANPFIKAVDYNYKVIEDARDENFQGYIWIDIFPLDHFPDDEKNHIKYLKTNKFYRNILNSNTVPDSYMKSRGYHKGVKKIISYFGAKVLYRLFGGYKKLSLKIDRLARQMDQANCNSNHVGDGALPNGQKDYFTVDDVTPVISHEFEGNQYCIPKNYDSYLTKFYGDYMQLPPEEQRGGHFIQVQKCTDADK